MPGASAVPTDFLLLLALTALLQAGLAGWLHRTGALRQYPRAAWAVVAALLGAGWFWTAAAADRAQGRLREQIARLLPTYAGEFERLGHARLNLARLDPADPLYLELLATQVRWLALNPFIADIYTFRRAADGRVVLLVDSETDYDHNGRYEGEREQRTPPGETYAQSLPELERAFAGERGFRDVPYTDRWGTWVSGFEPLRDANGAIEAVLGVDFEATRWVDAIGRARLLALIPVGLLIGLTSLGGALLACARTDAARRLAAERHLREQTYLAQVTDLSELRRAEARLREQQARLEAVLRSAPLVLVATDRHGTITVYEGAGTRAAGREPGALVGRNVAELFAGDPAILADLRRALAGEEFSSRHERNGAVFEVRVTPVRDDAGVVAGLTAVALDVTRLVRAEQEHGRMERRLLDAQKLESLGVLAGGVAHDFNNLLTAILGNAALARLALPPGAPAQVHVDRIEQASQTAAGLCRQLLVFAGASPLDTAPVDLTAIVGETAGLLQVSLGENTRLDLALASGLPPVLGDAAQLRQIVLNLVLNAAQAIGSRPGTVRLATGLETLDAAWFAAARIGQDAPPGPRVCLVVSDDGPGMDPATLARIFDPFFTTKPDGRGLGLASVLGSVRSHDGALQVRSEPGRGTTFTLAFPPRPAAAAAPTAPPGEAGAWRGRGAVLVVDDEASVRRTTAQMVAHFGFTVAEAGSGAAALALVESGQSYDVVLLDATMPELDGADTLAAIRRLRPAQRVVVFSGYSSPAMLPRFAALHPFGFLQKPFSPEALRDALRAALEK